MVQHHRRSYPRRPATALARWSGRAALTVGIICLGLGLVTPPAGADNARIAAEARCDRVVSWVVQAVADTSGGTADTPAEADRVRTNESVEVSYRPSESTDGGTKNWTPVDTSALDAANGFTFSGSFPLPASVDSVELRVQARADWADGSRAGSPKYAVAKVPSNCASMPLVAIVSPSCEAGGATVELRNMGDAAQPVAVSVDRTIARQLKLPAGGHSEMVVPILRGTSAIVRVNTGDFVVAQRKVDADCSGSGPAAAILERCPGAQAVVSATRGAKSQADGSIEVRVAGTIVQKGQLRTDEVYRRTLEMPSDGQATIEVKIDGKTAAIGKIGSCDGRVLGAVSCGGDNQPDCDSGLGGPGLEPPPIPPPSLNIELGGGGLPVTGPWQRAFALLFGGALLSLGGLAVIIDQRRRPRPSLLAASVDDYRRQWWT